MRGGKKTYCEGIERVERARGGKEGGRDRMRRFIMPRDVLDLKSMSFTSLGDQSCRSLGMAEEIYKYDCTIHRYEFNLCILFI